MTTINEDRDLQQNIDLLIVNVEQEIIPSLNRMEPTLASHGQQLGRIEAMLSRIMQHLGI